MAQITRESLLTLEGYAKVRAQFRTRVIAHKTNRQIRLGGHVALLFEDELTIRYQVQEMLRAERIFEEEGIRAELDAYNPLVPDGANWKATMMIEYPDEEERRVMLRKLIGIEDRVWVQIVGYPRVYAVADEDLERENAEKTSAVHFLRFELERATILALKAGARLSAGVEHPNYIAEVSTVDPATARSLAEDFVD